MTSTFQLCKDCTRAIPAKYQTCTQVPGNTRCEGDCVKHEELLDRPVPTVTTEALPNGARTLLTTDKCKRYLCEKLGAPPPSATAVGCASKEMSAQRPTDPEEGPRRHQRTEAGLQRV